MWKNYKPIKHLCSNDANAIGNDWIVGDLHGCYQDLQALLDYVKFDKSKDRLFSVGDLVDRGDDSLSVLSLLDEEYFYSVVGNHEVMMHEALVTKTVTDVMLWIQNGGAWVQFLSESEQATLARLLNKVKELPYLRTVKSNKERYHIIHSEILKSALMKDYDITDTELESEEFIENLSSISTNEGSALIWSRRFFYAISYLCKEQVDQNLDNIKSYFKKLKFKEYFQNTSTIYSGHTIVGQPVILKLNGIPKLINMDTGGYLRTKTISDVVNPMFGLSISKLGSAEFFTYTPNGIINNTPIIIDICD